MYDVESRNMTNVGGHMGTERIKTNWRKPVRGLAKAKEICEVEYGKKIDWVKTNDGIRSPDLLFVMYYIKEVKIIED